MQPFKLFRTTIALLTLIAVPALASAEGPFRNGPPGTQPVFKQLNLTDSQKQAMHDMFKQNRQQGKQNRGKMRALQGQIKAQVESPSFSADKVKPLLVEQQNLRASMAWQRALNRHKMWNLLSDTQQQQWRQLQQQRQGKMSQWRKSHKGQWQESRGVYRQLNLTAEQKKQLKALRMEMKTTDKSAFQALRMARKEEAALIQSADFNQQQWQQWYAKHQQQRLQLALSATEHKHKMWAILTPEQRQKMTELRGERRAQWHKGRHEPGPQW